MEKYTLITGASGGIGLELAKIFAKNNHNLVLVARSYDKLQRIKDNLEKKHNIKVIIIKKDLSDPNSPKELYNEVKQKNIFINILVNNAGYATFGRFYDLDIEKEINMIQLNVITLVYLTKLFLDDMIKFNEGKILNVASTAAFQPGPLMANYYASKAYVLSFSEALNEELKDKNISVTALCPGSTSTDFVKRANMEKSKLFYTLKPMSAEKVAKIAYDGLMNKKQVIITGFRNKLLAFLIRFIPRKIVPKFVMNIQKEMN
ncbi:SDR family NAD(P)-dependent oxidoreductase [Marinitoga litoralis]|uniref:SDR family NAD(P)-dependent oxidoreductase n=1 Tax=Marinitoga litoralis TaxID=570855 RepID=UPI00195F953B|nr:SDR family oxidoreductase [Marinitoga litoralis]MBM7559148.1 short-subunit dehydrogenase [Marinitoga litoralis]